MIIIVYIRVLYIHEILLLTKGVDAYDICRQCGDN